MSEKLDGIRGYWDGKKLRTKAGYVIHVPKYFIHNFPPFALDGELWIKRNAYEEVACVVLDEIPSKGWQKVTYNIFEVPKAEGNFSQRLAKAKSWFKAHPNKFVRFIPQKRCKNKTTLMRYLKKVTKLGGEGVIVKEPRVSYFSGRSDFILKVKSFSDSEAKVIAIHEGKGKFKNMMGSMTVQMEDGTVFKLGSGFKTNLRKNPPKIGTIVTFKYYGWTKNHKPKFASFLQVRAKETIAE